MKKMSKSICIVISMILITMALSSCQASSSEASVSDYFPVKNNTYYEYDGEGSDLAQQAVYINYNNGSRIQRIVSSGELRLTEVLEFGDGELKYIGGYGNYFFSDVSALPAFEYALIMKEPLKKGTKWQKETVTSSEITDMAAKIETPMGSYTAMEITSTTHRPATEQSPEVNYITKEYYAKGIGLVKTDTYLPDSQTPLVTINLVKITEKASLQLPINIAYPGEVYIEAEEHIITIVTNMDFKGILETEMKNPINTELNPLLTPNAKINAIEYVPAIAEQSESKAYVSIDISKDFINELSVDESAEAAKLNGIAYTLGSLYGVGFVEILIDGQNYDSGQIRFETGEFIKVE